MEYWAQHTVSPLDGRVGWTVVDDRYDEHVRAGEYLRVIRDGDGRSVGTARTMSRIPIIGGLFGAKSTNKARTELIIFLTPKVLYDTNSVLDATEEIKDSLTHLKKMMKDQ